MNAHEVGRSPSDKSLLTINFDSGEGGTIRAVVCFRVQGVAGSANARQSADELGDQVKKNTPFARILCLFIQAADSWRREKRGVAFVGESGSPAASIYENKRKVSGWQQKFGYFANPPDDLPVIAEIIEGQKSGREYVVRLNYSLLHPSRIEICRRVATRNEPPKYEDVLTNPDSLKQLLNLLGFDARSYGRRNEEVPGRKELHPPGRQMGGDQESEKTLAETQLSTTTIGNPPADFVGREWLTREVDNFLGSRALDSGYLLIEGEPGIGKTAFLSHLVHTRGYLSHFNRALEGVNNLRVMLENLTLQVRDRWGSPSRAAPPAAEENGVYLKALLMNTVHALASSQRLVVALDALDEVAWTPRDPRENVLFLPHVLPPRVFIVATTRPTERVALCVRDPRVLTIDSRSPSNLRDIETLIERRLETTSLRDWVASRRMSRSEVVKTLVEKSEGNFMYVHCVLSAVAQGTLDNVDVNKLPDGLKAYYRMHWGRMSQFDTDRFRRVSQPVICHLAVAQEMLTLPALARHSEIDPADAFAVLREWREFLRVVFDDHTRTYRYGLYHKSFRDFLAEEVGLREVEHALVDRMLAYHRNRE